MDGFEQLTRRHSAGVACLVLVTALLVVACGSGIQGGSPGHASAGGDTSSTSEETAVTTGGVVAVVDFGEPSVTVAVSSESSVTTMPADPAAAAQIEASGSVVVPPAYEVSVAATVSLEDELEMLGELDAERIRSRRVEEPRADLPSHAIRWSFSGVGEDYDPPQRPSEFVVANYLPTSLRVNVLCLVDGRQVSCSEDADVWRVELDEPGLAILALPEAEGRRDVLLLEESDERVERVYPISLARPIDGYDVPFSTLGDPLHEIVNPLGGCNWALFMDNLKPRDLFKPMRIRPPGPVYLVISICPDQSSHEMWPLIVVDDTTVAQVDAFQPFVAQPGATYVWKVPDELLDAGSKIRAAVVRRAWFGGHWVTHPLVTAAGELQ